MSLPRYPKYKDSDVEWLGEVPEHWRSVNLKWVSQIYSGGTPDKLNLDYWTDGTIPWLNSGAVNQGTIIEPSTHITQEAFEKSAAKWVKAGALVMALAGQGKTKGMVAQLGIPSTCNQSMAAIVPAGQFSARFLYWWLESNYENIRNLAGGDLRDGLNLEILGSIPCPLLPVSEQTSIAALLDREACKIDALVEEQRRLIELLKEKRQAVISHAVTKGLNPDAPMKDSGIEWLGEVPEHWQMTPLRWKSSVRSGESIATDDISEIESNEKAIPVIGGNGVMGYADKGNTVHPVLAIGRVGALCGNVHQIEPPAWVTDNALMLDINLDAFDLRFLSESLRARNLNDMASKTAQPLITGAQVKDQRVPCPPIEEQLAIAAYLCLETNKIDRLRIEAQRGIDLLQERRSALISAAVTGKIDVRGLVGKEAA